MSVPSDAIGLFDSGIGGLTIMQQLMHVLPQEQLIYLGDTARLPYGNKSAETIIRYSIENATYLIEKNIKLLVVACNTASAIAIEKLRQFFNIPIVGVVKPGAEKAVSVSRQQRIAVLATKATIQSGAYQKEILGLSPQATIFPIACPLLVPLIEEQWCHHPATSLVIQEYLHPLQHQNIDTVLLGCTHYPLLRSLIQQEMGQDVVIVDSASTCVKQVCAFLDQAQLKASNRQKHHEYFVSDDPDKFRFLGEKLLGQALGNVISFSPKHFPFY